MKAILNAVLFAGLLSAASCGNSELKEREAALQAQQRTLDSMNQAMAQQRIVDSMNAVLAMRDQARTDSIAAAEAAEKERQASVAATRTARSSSRSRTRSYSGNSQPVAQAPAVSNDVQEAPRKKGWSAKAKGAVIGAGAGAAAGAIINGRNRGAGAVIGGVLGAAAGTGTGAIIDKKNGRNEKR